MIPYPDVCRSSFAAFICHRQFDLGEAGEVTACGLLMPHHAVV
jgi:hypothetical protein